MMLETSQSRDQWLGKGVRALAPLFSDVGFPLPSTIHVSMGFPSKSALARKSRRIGECWDGRASTDGHCHIFISPTLTTPLECFDVLAHELIHVVTPGARHRGKFITVMKAIGLTGKPTATVAGPELKATLESFIEVMGPFPHAALTPSLGERKQSTRMIKCECDGCGYIARTSQKWLDDAGAPFCPSCACQLTVAN